MFHSHPAGSDSFAQWSKSCLMQDCQRTVDVVLCTTETILIGLYQRATAISRGAFITLYNVCLNLTLSSLRVPSACTTTCTLHIVYQQWCTVFGDFTHVKTTVVNESVSGFVSCNQETVDVIKTLYLHPGLFVPVISPDVLYMLYWLWFYLFKTSHMLYLFSYNLIISYLPLRILTLL